MGILNGNVILSKFHKGLYNRNAKNYEIYVDGELMRYKGMTSENLVKHDAEHGVAYTALAYLCKLIDSLKRHFGKPADKVTVFMDGQRVTNKLTRATTLQIDANLVRVLFVNGCVNAGMSVNNLVYGESELQMHMKHNKEQSLIVYITCDTDLLSILYGHKPTISDELIDFRKSNDNYDQQQQQQQQIDVNDCPYVISTSTSSNECNVFQDSNLIYETNRMDIKDSIVWLNCAKDVVVLYGMDNTICNGKFEPLVFRTFMAVCGTDFTPSAFTNSMIANIFNVDYEDLKFVNKLTDVFDIFVCLLVIGYKSGGVLKQKNKPRNSNVQRQEFVDMINYYIVYVTTGIMTDCCIPQPPMAWLTRYILWCSTDKRYFKTRKDQSRYFQNTSLTETLHHVTKNYDSEENRQAFYNSEFVEMATKPKVKRLIK